MQILISFQPAIFKINFIYYNHISLLTWHMLFWQSSMLIVQFSPEYPTTHSHV
jgi:hypothetical protein